MLSGGVKALLAAPWQMFRVYLQRLPQRTSDYHARQPAQEESQANFQLCAELDDLTRRGLDGVLINQLSDFRIHLSDGKSESSTLSVPSGLPEEYRLYLKGAVAWKGADLVRAKECFSAVLNLPLDDRRAKSTWAAYMLGLIDERDPQPHPLSPWFAKVRELAAAGLDDPLGLAAASYGMAGRHFFEQGSFCEAIHRYFEQRATGDSTADASLLLCVDKILNSSSDEERIRAARDPEVRSLVSARLLSCAFNSWHGENKAMADLWLATLRQTGADPQSEAGTMALIAYKTGDYEHASEWVELAPPEGVPACWIHAKLALREGRVEEAIRWLSKLVHNPDLDTYVEDTEQYTGAGFDNGLHAALSELATLHLARKDFTEALSLFWQAKNREDAAYVAERVLSVDELSAWLATQGEMPEIPSPVDGWVTAGDNHQQLLAQIHHLLARRLFRAGRMDEARAHYPLALRDEFDDYREDLRKGRDPAQSGEARSKALMKAAEILKKDGIALAGSELEPDYAIWNGNFTHGISVEQRIALAGPAAPSREEISRAYASVLTPAEQFHYRYLAADLAWEAAAFMPDNSPELVDALMMAGGWLKNRDPKAADRFYKALVNRCPDTKTGRAARDLHWFPQN